MSTSRIKLQETLREYTEDTLTNIHTVDEFCVHIQTWCSRRQNEMIKMLDIKASADKKEKKLKLEKELGSVLENTLEGLKELDRFSDAVEKLAVTSHHVFAEENQVLHLPEGIGCGDVKNEIIAAQEICPLLLEFKRDARRFFLPRLQNIESLLSQLERYIQTANIICDMLKKSFFSNFDPKEKTMKSVIDLNSLPEEEVQRMLDHIDQLYNIRKNQNFRMVFLFEDDLRSNFIQSFKECQPRMLQFLEDLEGNAVQLDKMNKGSKISNVVGSSVGATGGVLSIIGLALIPFTAGVSLGLTMTGLAMGVGSGANTLVTTATEMCVNHNQQKKASETFESFMKDVQVLQKYLEDARNVMRCVEDEITQECEVAEICKKIAQKSSERIHLVGKHITGKTFSKVASDSAAVRNASRLALDVPDVGQAVAKGSLALSKTARVGLMALNGAFVGLDVFFICKDSISLAKGSEAEFSKLLRARAALWKSEIDAWKKIHDSLCEGEPSAKENQAILDKPFYPGLE